jgi:hypothetical protein
MATRNIKRILDIEVRDYARHVKNGVENRFHLAKPRYNDYPAMVSACSETSRNAAIHKASSCTPIAKYIMAPLRALLVSRLGTIGERSAKTQCDNIIGKCAEVHAANKLLKSNIQYPINDIVFSIPIRPRTGEEKQYCVNCQTIFNV